MTQTAYNTTMTIPEEWTLVSEINCTFVVNGWPVEVIGTDGAAPDSGQHGIVYRQGEGEDASTDMLARFTGAGTADRLYMRGIGGTAQVFVSRAAVA